ncbi:MAG: PQQ-binding-like beta-propeller repeat protein [Caulobacterales bacterium]
MKSWTVGLVTAPLALAAALVVGAQAQPAKPEATRGPGGEYARIAAITATGEPLFKAHCAMCHDPAQGRAPGREQLAARWPEDVLKALKTGVMKPMAEGLSDDDMTAVAVYLTGRLPSPVAQVAADPPACAKPDVFSLAGPGWNGWSVDKRNWRLQPDPGLTASQAQRLKVKWAFTYVGGRYGQPTIVGGRLFLTSFSGQIYSLDAKTGCLRWRFDAGAGSRTTVSVGPLKSAPSGYAAYFGDAERNVYAVDARAGTLIWKVNVEAHPRGVLTGAPALFKDRLYVPLSSYEETVAGAGAYQCCTARGGVAAIDVTTGQIAWKTYAISQAPQPRRKNAAGTQMFGPAGAAVWSAPTIDAKRGLVLFATGDSYTDEAQDGSDAIVAADLATGQVRWRRQVTEGDNFLMGCPPQRPVVNCPTKLGPDHDFGASPIIVPLAGGRDIVLAGQKSGAVFGVDADGGKILWRTQVGEGGALGGIEWGMASDGKRLYVANADPFSFDGKGRPGLYALDPASGKILWSTPAPKVACSYKTTRCVNAQSAAPSMIPGLVLATTMDGHLRGYDPKDGKILWDFDTAGQTYKTINGVAAQGGGSLDVAGPTLAGGMAYIISGYEGVIGGVPDNVLLAFSVDGK